MSVPRCPQCDYDMRGHDAATRCPECGLVYDVEQIACPARLYRHGHDVIAYSVTSLIAMGIVLYVAHRLAIVTGPFPVTEAVFVLVAAVLVLFGSQLLLRPTLTRSSVLFVEPSGLRFRFAHDRSREIPWRAIRRAHENHLSRKPGMRLETRRFLGLRWYVTFDLEHTPVQTKIILDAIHDRIRDARER